MCCAKNVVAAIRGSQKAAFRFRTVGQLASIGHHAGVAEILGLRLSGFPAWFLWRTIYLAKLPTFEKKLRVALRWTLDFMFPRDLTQHVTLQGIDRVTQLLAYARQHPVFPRSAIADHFRPVQTKSDGAWKTILKSHKISAVTAMDVIGISFINRSCV